MGRSTRVHQARAHGEVAVSIYATWLMFDDVWDADDEDSALGPPFVYYGSHVFPTVENQRAGELEIGAIPGYVDSPSRGVTALEDEDKCHPWLRLGVNEATVILTPEHVRRMRDVLSEWLERLG